MDASLYAVLFGAVGEAQSLTYRRRYEVVELGCRQVA